MSIEPRTFRYPTAAVWPDAARGSVGFLATAAPLPWLLESPVAFAILACLAVAFGAFTFSTARRFGTILRLDETGISTSGARNATVPWDKMQAVDLSYFSTRRDREKGWMQLRVRGDAGTIRIDSSLDGFRTVADQAIAAASERNLPLSEATLANQSALADGSLERTGSSERRGSRPARWPDRN